jgi:phenylalanyl-tRNA synthetase alpha chain
MSETLQQLILDTLNEQSVINDSRSLILPGKSDPAASPDEQMIVLGALNSLLSREVLVPSCHLLNSQPMSLSDG